MAIFTNLKEKAASSSTTALLYELRSIHEELWKAYRRGCTHPFYRYQSAGKRRFSFPTRLFNDQLPPGTPVLIFYPGCAFVFDLFDVNSNICSRIAEAAGIKVILVQFRLAPGKILCLSVFMTVMMLLSTLLHTPSPLALIQRESSWVVGVQEPIAQQQFQALPTKAKLLISTIKSCSAEALTLLNQLTISMIMRIKIKP